MTNPTPNVKGFELSSEILDEIEVSLSPERLETYLDEVGGNRIKAVRLYTWNTAISAAFYGPLQALEVALRNAMNHELARVYGQAWYDNQKAGLDDNCLSQIKREKEYLRKNNFPANPPQMIASLSFGFWVSLLGRGSLIANTKANYEMTLWRPALRPAFPHTKRLTRAHIHERLKFLKTLRNRIAHHEPIFRRQLEKDYEDILEITSWIVPHKRNWIEVHSRVPEILAEPRDSTILKF